MIAIKVLVFFFLLFLIIAIWPVFTSESVRVWAIILSLIFLVLGIINSKLLTPFKKIWIKLGENLGKFIAPIVMGFIYFFDYYSYWSFYAFNKKRFIEY